MALFNQVAKRHPPPTSRMYYMMGLFMLWMVAFTVFYYVWIKFHASYILLGLPVFMLLTSFILAWISKRRMIKVQINIMEKKKFIKGAHCCFHSLKMKYYKSVQG